MRMVAVNNIYSHLDKFMEKLLFKRIRSLHIFIISMIRDNKIHQIQSMIETGQKYGMQTLNACLVELVMSRRIEKGEAAIRCTDRESFDRLLRGKYQ